MRRPSIVVYLLLLLTLTGAAPPASGESPVSGRLAHGASDPQAEPAQVQVSIAKWVVGQVIGWGAGKVMDAAVDRILLATKARDAEINLDQLSRDPAVSGVDRQELRQLAGQMGNIATLLRRNELGDAQVRARIRQMQAELSGMQRRIDVLDRRISALEQEQKRQMRVLVNHEGRIQRLESVVANHDGRLTRVEDIVYPDSNRYLRHDAYLAAGMLYANSAKLGNDAAVGFEVTGQYNFSQYFGAFGGAQIAPLKASDVEGMPSGSAVSWEGFNAHLGGVVSMAPPRQPVSLQIGLGGGISQTKLLYFAPGTDRTQSEYADELGSSSNVYMLLKADLGVAPPAFEFEPVVSVGYMTFFEDMTYTDDAISSNAGRALWYASVGLRWRAYLRGRPEATATRR
ncbi:MAG: hypothetical protein AVDCRST_MAG68-1056 [uncultured Gemmatimonadetes bacterium]|uniref:Uncharacterized protein n=1 Tax=uncultured Gemmatimonadota bacterium TaxID=203437 RepID=A0A6J4KPI9_9BACT|nr:MAG: hypothetical protein AVDCRST_MAG68-1056 [uncultured Gemmatimonadota bacterium]